MPVEQGGSIASVFQNIVGNIEQIVRSEVRLAKAEVYEEIGKAGTSAKSIAIGAVCGLYAFGLLLLCIIYALTTVVPAWVAALIVAAVLGFFATVLISGGIATLNSINPVPDKTIETLKDNMKWAKEQIK